MTQPGNLDPETRARIEAEEAYRAQVRAQQEAALKGAKVPPPPPTKKKGPGCVGWGCGIFLLVGVIGALMPKSASESSSTAAAQDPISSPAEPVAESSSVGEVAPSTSSVYRITSENYIGCSEEGVYRRLVDFAVQKDREAFARLYTGNDCITFTKGEEVRLDDVAVLKGMIKVRRPGDVEGYWTAFEAADNE